MTVSMSHKGLILDKHGHNYSVHADCKLDKQHYPRASAVKVCVSTICVPPRTRI